MTEVPRTCVQCGDGFYASGVPRDLTGPADSQLLCPNCAPPKLTKAVAKRIWQAAGSLIAIAIPLAILIHDFVTDQDDPAEAPNPIYIDTSSVTNTGSDTDTVSTIVYPLLGTPNAKATPSNDPGSWIEPGDYPLSALRNNRSGTVAFTLQIDELGYATDCTVTKSSGADDLDAATCIYVAQRARFSPARDDSGSTVAGTYHDTITWRIED